MFESVWEARTSGRIAALFIARILATNLTTALLTWFGSRRTFFSFRLLCFRRLVILWENSCQQGSLISTTALLRLLVCTRSFWASFRPFGLLFLRIRFIFVCAQNILGIFCPSLSTKREVIGKLPKLSTHLPTVAWLASRVSPESGDSSKSSSIVGAIEGSSMQL